MENSQVLLEGSSDLEKGAYLGAIASLATVDRQASEDEVEYLEALCVAAKLSDEQTDSVLKAANEITAEEVKHCLDVLKTSDLKYSLIADLIAFAKSDNNYSEDEQQNVQKMAQYLGVDQKQFSLLNNFTNKVAEAKPTPEQIKEPGFLSSLGLSDSLQSAGINGGGLLKGLIGVAGPMLLMGMLSGGRRRRGGGMFGGGGMLGGGGGMLGGGLLGGGGLGSIIGMLAGGRGMGSMGGLLGGLFGGGRKGW